MRAFVLRDVLEALEREHPGHPLAAVFKPLFVEDERTLERAAVGYFRQIKYSELGTACKANLLEVFVSWLEQRLNQKSKKEIEIMLVGELPALEETQSGKDLIRIGEERGVRRGLARAILVSLRTRYSTVPVAIEDKVHALTVEEAERLLDYLPRCPSLDELDQWFADAKP